MCFSAEMDLVAGITITVVGMDAARHVTHRSQIALASIPLLFGIHQLIETLVWWDLEGRVSSCTGDAATWLYLLIALSLVPIAVPLAFVTLGLGRSAAFDRLCLAIGCGVEPHRVAGGPGRLGHGLIVDGVRQPLDPGSSRPVNELGRGPARRGVVARGRGEGRRG